MKAIIEAAANQTDDTFVMGEIELVQMRVLLDVEPTTAICAICTHGLYGNKLNEPMPVLIKFVSEDSIEMCINDISGTFLGTYDTPTLK